MTNQDYGKLVNERSKPSPMGKNMVWASAPLVRDL